MTERLYSKKTVETSKEESKPYKFVAQESPFTKQAYPANILEILVTP